jgi:hypothetical protein
MLRLALRLVLCFSTLAAFARNHVVRYRFLNVQQAIDGSTVLTFLPPAADPSTISFIRDSEYWVRKK